MKSNMHRILFLLLILVFVPSFAYCQTPELSVEVTPNQMTLPPGEHFTVNAKIINNSNAEQNISDWLCSYEMNWSPDNSLITFQGWGCNKNFVEKITITSGGFYERKIDLQLSKNAQGTVSFRMQFANATDKVVDGHSVWRMDHALISNPITITVDKTTPQVQKQVNQ